VGFWLSFVQTISSRLQVQLLATAGSVIEFNGDVVAI